MDINFTGEYEINGNEITFFALADTQTVSCIVSKAALNAMANTEESEDTETQFLDNQYMLEEIAEGMMLNHQIVDGKIHITQTQL